MEDAELLLEEQEVNEIMEATGLDRETASRIVRHSQQVRVEKPSGLRRIGWSDQPRPSLAPSASAPTSSEIPAPSCPTCKDAGWLVGERGALHACGCGVAQRDSLGRLAGELRRAMGPKLAAQQLDVWDTAWPERLHPPERFVWNGKEYGPKEQVASLRAAHALACTYAAHPAGWLYFVGPVGSGKSSLMAALMNALAERDVVGLYTLAGDMLDYIRAGFDRKAEERADERMARFRECPLLCLDDLGTENVTDWSETALFTILNARQQNNRLTIITSNLPLDKISPRIQSRIAGMSAGDTPEILVMAPDARLHYRRSLR